jgi:hypothetical protein
MLIALVNTTAPGAVKGAGEVDVLKKRRSMRPKPLGLSKPLMVRRRASAVSNHEATVASSFETRRKRRSSG